MFLRQIDLTTALRPCLLPEETLLGVFDSVGLYRDKYKIELHQDGQLYLTSHRIIYVDNQDARLHSVAVDLKDVASLELSAGFLRSSPKISLYPRTQPSQSLAIRSVTSSPVGSADGSSPRLGSGPSSVPARLRDANAVWICPICSFSNPVPVHFDPSTANEYTLLPACSACGIKPPLIHVTKAAIAALSRATGTSTYAAESFGRQSERSTTCPRCTFENHVSLQTCEICGTSLARAAKRGLVDDARSASPGPSTPAMVKQSASDVIKLSFRAGGEKIASDRIKNALIQRQWLLQNAPPIPAAGDTTNQSTTGASQSPAPKRQVGIAGLEGRGFNARLANQTVIGHAFDDLEALMTSAKEVIAMAERFAAQAKTTPNDDPSTSALLSASASALGLVATKDMLGTGNKSVNDSLYITQLSRDLAEYLTDDKRGILRREGGIISLVDLWAVFNRSRNGIELVSPLDFEKAVHAWEQLRLPIRLRQFKSGLLVVQGRDRTDEKTTASILDWLEAFRQVSPSPTSAVGLSGAVTWDWRTFGLGVTAQDTATRFGWSVGVATEELEMAEDRGVLVREQGAAGIKFWRNYFPGD